MENVEGVGMKRRIAVRAIIIDDGRLFCVRQLHDGVPSDFWCTPGGGVDFAEPLESALHREMVEETGVVPVIGSLLYVQQFMHEGTEHIEFFFHVTITNDYKSIDLAATSHGQHEIAEYAFISKENNILPAFLQTDLSVDHPTRFYHYDLNK